MYLSVLIILLHNNHYYVIKVPIPLAALSKALVYGRSPAAIVGSNPTGGMDVCLLCVVR
jgi:hypothetical protein